MTQKVSDLFQCGGAAGLVPNDILTGNIIGLEYSYSTASQIGVGKGTCYDSLNATKIVKNGDTTVDLIEANIASWAVDGSAVLINTIYNIFVIEGGGIKFDTDVEGANIAEKKRWIGFVLTDDTGSGGIIEFKQSGDSLTFTTVDGVLINSGITSTSFVEYSLLSLLPTVRCETIGYTTKHTSNQRVIIFSLDGVDEILVGEVSGISVWGSLLYLSATPSVWLKVEESTGSVKISAVTLKR